MSATCPGPRPSEGVNPPACLSVLKRDPACGDVPGFSIYKICPATIAIAGTYTIVRAGRARTSGEGRGLLGEAGLIAAPVDQGPSLLRQAIGTGQGLEHSVEGIVLEQIAFLDIGGEGGVALVAAELLQLGGMHPPVLRGIHGAALQAVPA